MIEVRVQGDDAASVMKDLRELSHAGPTLSGQPETPKKVAKNEAPKDAPKEVTKREAPKEAAGPGAASPAAPTEAALSVQDIKIRIPKLMDTLGKAKLVQFLATFNGATKGSEVPESMYAEFIAKADAVVE